MNLANILEESAKRLPSKDAIILNDKRLTFQQLNNIASKIANALIRSGINPGDKVALSCLNLPSFPAIYFGILKTGAVVVPLSVLLKRDEVAYHLKDSDAKFLFCFEGNDALPMGIEGYEGFKEAAFCKEFITIAATPNLPSKIKGTITLDEFIESELETFKTVDTNPQDTAVIIYTSGTTGRPKGAELTHSNLISNAKVCKDVFGMVENDITLSVLPLFHIFGQTCLMNTSILIGITNVFMVRFEAQGVVDLMIKENVTAFGGVPTMYWGLVNQKTENQDIEKVKKHLRLCISGGASLPLQILNDFEGKFKVPIIEGYGMSEGSPVVTFNTLDNERKPGSVGLPVKDVDVIIVDEKNNEVPVGEKGELLYRGPNVMKGYYKKPEENEKTLKNGWMHSGDIAIKDEDGYFYIVDRTKDMIIRGGLNVYPREVEEIIIQHNAISFVAIIGVPDEKFGEEIKAFLVLKDNKTLTESEIIAWTKERVAAYKYPRIIEFVDQLPMSATGKILKKKLRSKD